MNIHFNNTIEVIRIIRYLLKVPNLKVRIFDSRDMTKCLAHAHYGMSTSGKMRVFYVNTVTAEYHVKAGGLWVAKQMMDLLRRDHNLTLSVGGPHVRRIK